ncbi:patatin-like phospholipase family protein [Persicobacter psychrovividus]|uniref:PNPLA domain-containing protein n=1 Tax=Persicobacter psychrovividus TaxID=387638 RepID=A0ABN6LCH9_9BACT|nr:hypothetical protein PEPS_12870 [Persicobacter psychrovividus]
MKNYSSIGGVFSGGGVRGVAHLGVIKALQARGINFDIVAGTSSGALVACFYAAGVSPDDTLEIFKTLTVRKLLKPAWNRRGLLDLHQLTPLFDQYLPVRTFEALEKPLTICAINMTDGQVKYFQSGDLYAPLMASCALPGIFAPIIIDGKQYVDGGMLNNLPVEAILGRADFIVGSHCNVVKKGDELLTIKKNIERCLLMAVGANVKNSQKWCNWFIEPPLLCDFQALEMKRLDQIFQIGYEYASRYLDSHL